MDDDTAADCDLLRRCGAGDVAAFTALVRRHQAAVVAVAFAVVCDRDGAADLTQEAFVRAWHRITEVRDPGRVRAWLCGIVRFLARDHRRRERRRHALLEQAPAAPPPATPLDRALAREDDQVLREVVTALPERYREALLLHYVVGCSVAEIAAALAISPDATKQRLSRGRGVLREVLADQGRDEPRFARAALALVPSPMFAPATAHAATHRAPKGAQESFMATHPILTLTLAVTVAGAAGMVATHHARDDAQAGSSSSSVDRGADAAVTSPRSVRPISPPDRAAVRAALRARRASAVPAMGAARPAPLTYDFAGEVMRASEPPIPAFNVPIDLTTVNKWGIREALAAARPAILSCYQQARRGRPELAGTYRLHLVLEFAEEVGAVATEAEMIPEAGAADDAGLIACMQAAALEFELPVETPFARIDVHYPFILRP